MNDREDIESLLAKFKTEYRQQQTPPTPSQANPNLDDALASLRENKAEKESENPAVDNLFADFQADFATKNQKKSDSNFSFPQIRSPQAVNVDSLLDGIKSEVKKQETIVNKPIDKQNISEIQQKELNSQKQKRLSLQRAEAWLKSVEPDSDEWLWFEQFAYSYESKIEAAIDYLKAIGKLE